MLTKYYSRLSSKCSSTLLPVNDEELGQWMPSSFWENGSKPVWYPSHANSPQGRGTSLAIWESALCPPVLTTGTKVSPVWVEDSPSFHQQLLGM